MKTRVRQFLLVTLLLLVLSQSPVCAGMPKLVLIQGQSRILTVNNLTRVAVGDQTIVDVAVVDSSQVILNPLQVGITSLHLWSSNSQQAYRVRVVADDGTLIKEYLTALNLPQVSAWFADKHLILEGQVATDKDKERAENLAAAYSDSVISLLQVPAANFERQLERELRRLISPEIELTVLNNTVILEGEVVEDSKRQLAIQIAETFNYRVLDLVEVTGSGETQSELEPADYAAQIQAVVGEGVQVFLIGETIFLEGFVDDEFNRQRAVAIAKAFGHPVVDLLQINHQPAEEEILVPDASLSEQSLLGEIEKLIDNPRLTLKIVYDCLIIEGEVSSQWEKDRAARIAGVAGLPVIDLIVIVPGENAQPPAEIPELDQSQLETLLAGTNISAHWINDTLVLEGTVRDEFDKTRAKLLGQAFTDHVIDLVRVLPPPVLNTSEPNLDFESELIQDIAAAVNEPGVSVSFYNDTIVLEGVVPDQKAKARAERLAAVFYQPVESFIQYPQPGVISAADQLAVHLNLPDVKITAVGTKLVLEGTVQTAQEHNRVLQIAELYGDVIDLLVVEKPEQVLLQVHIVELDRSAGEQLGVKWGSLIEGQLFANRVQFEEIAHIGSWQMNRSHILGAELTVLEKEGKAKLLAAPSLLTAVGEPASFLAGGEIPVVIQVGEQQMIEWIVYGVKLEILPTIVGDQIRIHVKPEVSSLDWQTSTRLQTSMPPLKTRRTDAIVNLEHGATAVIGGLIQHEESTQIEKIPILGDLPIIGALFRSTEYQERQTELVVFVTPWIVSEGVGTSDSR